MASPDEIRKTNQRTIIMLLAAFIVPVVAAYVVYINMDSVSKTRNYGELITPARPLVKLNLNTIDNKPYTIEQLKGNWHLVYLGKGACDKLCRDSLLKIHQTRLAQGKAMSRVRLLYIAANKPSQAEAETLLHDYSRLSVVTGNQASINEVIKLFQTQSGVNAMDSQQIYMIDPLGNLMMQYKNDTALIGIIKDLEHLLKISHVG